MNYKPINQLNFQAVPSADGLLDMGTAHQLTFLSAQNTP